MQFLRAVVCSTVLAAALPAQSLSDPLPISTRIEVKQGNGWHRAVVSEDKGPSAPTIKVRLDPNNEFAIVPRNTVRLAPRPTSIQVGDRLEWNGNSVTSFGYVPATVKGIGAGAFAGYYLMAWDKYPNSPTYAKPDQLWLLPEGSDAGVSTASAGPLPGKYRCFSYGAGGSQLFMTNIEFREGGTYVAYGKDGKYSFDAASQTVNWISGWAKENNLQGKVESNAKIRIMRNAVCSHE